MSKRKSAKASTAAALTDKERQELELWRKLGAQMTRSMDATTQVLSTVIERPVRSGLGLADAIAPRAAESRPIPVPEKPRRGRKKRLQAREQREYDYALVVAASRISPTKVANRLADLAADRLGRSPVKRSQYIKTLQNRISKARARVRKELLLEFGDTAEAEERLRKLKLLTKPKRTP
ncbi:hypothetical protein [Ideonella alba]|uniref:Uncharacterized protein n=1 Tax=Ideonella alba TaxID=2824118 RepID=A0A941BH82_9BURK|nr:hypothetical protein [Ideonella alba]MBQ0932867.1 hypothetical protein [Ideonella alba]